MSEYVVTILIPAYNAEAYIRQCLDSIFLQTYRNLQVVVIDDGSKDTTLDICQHYSALDKRLEVYHQENQGVALTRNHLLEKVKGDWVLFVDADDWIEPDMVESLLKLAVENNAEIAECKNVINDAECYKENPEITLLNREETILQFLRHTDFCGSLWNKLIKTNLLFDEWFPDNVSYGEDAFFCWHVLQKVNTVARSTAQYYHHSMAEGSLSHLNWTPEKKGSGSITWSIITKETSEWWPQYLAVAKARYAIEDMWGLYFASLAEYPYDEHIRKRQLNVRNNLKLIRKSGLVSMNKIVTCYALAYCYALGRFLKYTRK